MIMLVDLSWTKITLDYPWLQGKGFVELVKVALA